VLVRTSREVAGIKFSRPVHWYLTRLEQVFSLLLVHTLSTVVHGTCA